jgi:amino acid transporter
MAWGMATDNALPFSNIFVRISPKWESPIYTILLTVAAELAIGVLEFPGNDTITSAANVFPRSCRIWEQLRFSGDR